MTAWVVCLSSFIYVKMEKPEKYLSHLDEGGEIVIDEYVSREFNDQYGYEGYIFSCLVAAVGLCFLAVIQAPKYIENPVLVRVVTLSFMALAYYGYEALLSLYRIKDKTYDPKFEPREYMMEGSLMAN